MTRHSGRRPVEIGERQDGFVPGWWCEAKVGGLVYRVGVLAIPVDDGRPDTWGVVRDSAGRILWQDRVPASTDPRMLLTLAGLGDV